MAVIKCVEDGRCPLCGSTNIDCRFSHEDDYGCWDEMKCADCKCEFTEYYETQTVYNHCSIYDKDFYPGDEGKAVEPPKQRLNVQSERCPLCGEVYFDRQDMKQDGPLYKCECCCRCCHAEWNNVYTIEDCRAGTVQRTWSGAFVLEKKYPLPQTGVEIKGKFFPIGAKDEAID